MLLAMGNLLEDLGKGDSGRRSRMGGILRRGGLAVAAVAALAVGALTGAGEAEAASGQWVTDPSTGSSCYMEESGGQWRVPGCVVNQDGWEYWLEFTPRSDNCVYFYGYGEAQWFRAGCYGSDAYGTTYTDAQGNVHRWDGYAPSGSAATYDTGLGTDVGVPQMSDADIRLAAAQMERDTLNKRIEYDTLMHAAKVKERMVLAWSTLNYDNPLDPYNVYP